MRVSEILNLERIRLAGPNALLDGNAVMGALAEMLAPGAGLSASNIEEQLNAREQLQTTAIGSGVAVPHARFDTIAEQFGALIVCPKGVEFGAIDQAPVRIFLGVIGPQGQTKRHLQLLTAISRVLRDARTRQRLIECPNHGALYELLQSVESE